jgi:uncharacterized membrane protein
LKAQTATTTLARDVASPSAVRTRIESIDVVRGIIMILMALDHTREFFGVIAVSPTDIARTTAPLFFARWITHICAPVFFLLTGTGAYLVLRRRTVGELAWWLFTRGAWLIVLELSAVRCLGYQFNFDYRVTMLVVLWALGWAMIFLSALVPMASPRVIAVIGVAMIVTHNLLDPIRAASLGALAPIWSILHSPGIVVANPEHIVFAAYPLIPWVGVTAVGFGLGEFYRDRTAERETFLLRVGIGLVVAFVLLRFLNVYGDPARWAAQRSPIFTVLSFLNTTKYPPSLLFLLMTLGPAALLLWLVDRGTLRALQPALVFGRVPLFFFVLHLWLIHALAVLVCYVRYGGARWMFESPDLQSYPITQPPGWGYSLPIVYLLWWIVVLTLYPACRWYAGIKLRRRDWWLSYL